MRCLLDGELPWRGGYGVLVLVVCARSADETLRIVASLPHLLLVNTSHNGMVIVDSFLWYWMHTLSLLLTCTVFVTAHGVRLHRSRLPLRLEARPGKICTKAYLSVVVMQWLREHSIGLINDSLHVASVHHTPVFALGCYSSGLRWLPVLRNAGDNYIQCWELISFTLHLSEGVWCPPWSRADDAIYTVCLCASLASLHTIKFERELRCSTKLPRFLSQTLT